MAELITCAECGKSLSSSVKYRCIHCGNDPRPKKCLFCNKTLKASDVALKEDVTLHSIGSHTYYFCKNCIENLRNNVETERFSCPTCHGLLYYKDFQKEEARCPQCGESLYFGACRFCGKRYEKNSAHNECYKLYEKKATEENKRLSEYKYDAKANVLGVITALILSVIGCILGIIAGLLLYIPLGIILKIILGITLKEESAMFIGGITCALIGGIAGFFIGSGRT